MAMNKQEQEFYNRAIETGKKYEQLYTNLHNKFEDFKSYLRVRTNILSENLKFSEPENLNEYEKLATKEYQICKEMLNYLQ